MDKPFLNKKDLNSKLLKDGYVKLSLFVPEQLKKVRDFFFSETPKNYQTMFSTFFIQDYEYKKAVNTFLNQFIGTRIKHQISSEYYSIFSNFMVKPPMSENLLLHSDWTYTDEIENYSYNLWVPLENINSNNGGLWVVPKSHQFMNAIRGINLPRVQYLNEFEIQNRYSIPLNVNFGEAIIWNSRLLHFSFPNFSKKTRLAFSNFFVPKTCNKYYYFFDYDKNKLNKYEVKDSNFLLTQTYNQPPDIKYLIQKLEPNVIGKFDIHKFKKQVRKSSIINSYKSWKLINKTKKLMLQEGTSPFT